MKKNFPKLQLIEPTQNFGNDENESQQIRDKTNCTPNQPPTKLSPPKSKFTHNFYYIRLNLEFVVNLTCFRIAQSGLANRVSTENDYWMYVSSHVDKVT